MTTVTIPSSSQPVLGLPEPSRTRATCAWCRVGFATIVELLAHADDHLVSAGGRRDDTIHNHLLPAWGVHN